MQIGIAIDGSVGLNWDEQRQLARDAVELGYDSMWTPGFGGRDPFQKCSQWSAATQDLRPGGIGVGTSVVSVPLWHPMTLAVAAAAMADVSQGQFVLGIGPSAIASANYRSMMGVPYVAPLTLMREYVAVLRRLLAGERVSFQGEAVQLNGAGLGFAPAPVRIQLGGMAQNLLQLAGEIADGATLNWCSAERVRWSREQVDTGAIRAGRDPSTVTMSGHIRVSVDDDPKVARRALAVSVSHYALADPGESTTASYRGQFARMGYDALLTELEARRDAGASEEEICAAFPNEMLETVGCYGTPADIGPKFAKLAAGLDVPIVRIVNPRPGLAGARAVIEACRPEAIAPLMA